MKKKESQFIKLLKSRREAREQADLASFLQADEITQRYILHKDYVRLADEIKKTRRWLILILAFTFFAVAQIANFFVR